MATAGWCSDCNANVWVGPDGGCINGHPRSSLRALYESSQTAATADVLVSSVGARTQVTAPGTASVRDVAEAQKLVIYAFVLNILFNVLSRSGSTLTVLLALAASLFAVISVYRLAQTLDYSSGLRILFVVLMFVPLASLIVLLMLIDRATKVLRAAGYKVGLLGARV